MTNRHLANYPPLARPAAADLSSSPLNFETARQGRGRMCPTPSGNTSHDDGLALGEPLRNCRIVPPIIRFRAGNHYVISQVTSGRRRRAYFSLRLSGSPPESSICQRSWYGHRNPPESHQPFLHFGTSDARSNKPSGRHRNRTCGRRRNTAALATLEQVGNSYQNNKVLQSPMLVLLRISLFGEQGGNAAG